MDAVLEDAVGRWRRADLLDEATIAAIRRYEEDRRGTDAPTPGEDRRGTDAPTPAEDRRATDAPTPAEDVERVLPAGRVGLLAEGLAYLGAALAFGAGAALFAELWSELSGLARTLVAASGTLAVGGAAAALGGSDSAAVRRLRSLLGALAVVGVGATVGIGTAEATSLGEEVVALLAGGAALVTAVPVHLARPSWPSALVTGAALLTTVLAGEATVGWGDDELTVGVTLASLGLGWAALGWAGWLAPRAAIEVPGLLAAAAGFQVLAVGAFPVGAPSVALLLAGGVLAIGLVEERTTPAVLGGLGVTVFAPQLVFEVFGDTVGGPLALFVGGLALVTVAVLVLRQRGTP